MAKLIEELESGSITVELSTGESVLIIKSNAAFVPANSPKRYKAQELLKDEPGYINDEHGESLSIGDGWRIDINEDSVEQAWCRGW